MEIIIRGEAKELAALVVELQERRVEKTDKELAEAVVAYINNNAPKDAPRLVL